MVYLTMTSTILEALETIRSLEESADEKCQVHFKEGPTGSLEASPTTEEETGEAPSILNNGEKQGDSVKTMTSKNKQSNEPSLSNPKLGNPISHGQVIGLSRQLKAQGLSPRNLGVLVRGARVYVPPPPPKPEPVGAVWPFKLHVSLIHLSRPLNTKP
jgi:hypothetical protein